MQTLFSCPACGGEVRFLSPVSMTATCPWCASLLLRHELELEKYGSESLPPPDLSVVQIGTQGRYQGIAFSVVGKLVVGWADGRWNEWYLYCEDGRDGWLAEAQGEWMMSFAEQDLPPLPDRAEIAVGNRIELGKSGCFVVTDLREVSCLGCAGELPIKAARGRAGLSVDLTGPDEQFACIEYSNDGTRIYLGRYVDFESLHLTCLRELDGW